MARRIPVREMLRLRASGLSATAIARAQPVSKDQRGRHVPRRRRERGRLGGRRGDVGRGGLRAAVPGEGARRAGLRGPRLGPRPPRARPGRRDAQAAARGVPRRAEVEGRALHVLRPVLQALPGVHGEKAGGEPRRAQGGKDTRGRLAGPTMALVDPATGEVSKVFLFVACLPSAA